MGLGVPGEVPGGNSVRRRQRVSNRQVGGSRLHISRVSLVHGYGIWVGSSSGCGFRKRRPGVLRLKFQGQVPGLKSKVYRIKAGILMLDEGWCLKCGVSQLELDFEV